MPSPCFCPKTGQKHDFVFAVPPARIKGSYCRDGTGAVPYRGFLEFLTILFMEGLIFCKITVNLPFFSFHSGYFPIIMVQKQKGGFP